MRTRSASLKRGINIFHSQLVEFMNILIVASPKLKIRILFIPFPEEAAVFPSFEADWNGTQRNFEFFPGPETGVGGCRNETEMMMKKKRFEKINPSDVIS